LGFALADSDPFCGVDLDSCVETVAQGQPVGCYAKEGSHYTERALTDRLIRLEIPRIGVKCLQMCGFSWKIPLCRADPRRSEFARCAFEPAETP
jgi:hypothetical protein